jgi:hypothetical protein
MDVERIVGRLPDTAEVSPRNWRVRKKLIVWERPLRKADHAALRRLSHDAGQAGCDRRS